MADNRIPRAGAPNSAPQPKRPLTPREKHELRLKKRRRQRRITFLFSAVFILVVTSIITAIIEIPAKIKTDKQEAAAASQLEAQQQEQSQTDSTTQAALGEFGPVKLTDWTYQQPTAAIMSQPENGRVDTSYFDDALFIGDSLTQGFQVYESIQNAHYAAYIGVGPKQLISGTVTDKDGNVVTAIDQILAANANKVYILLGTNTLGSLDDEALLKYYDDFLDFLQPQMAADVVYYLQGIPPVTAEKAQSDANYSNDRIKNINGSLAKMAYERGWHYIDLYSALAGDDGALRGELVAGSDGVHLNSAGYEAWKEYLITHTAYSSTSPYIAGSAYLL
jgi:lysophospholipase L1-like esterase